MLRSKGVGVAATTGDHPITVTVGHTSPVYLSYSMYFVRASGHGVMHHGLRRRRIVCNVDHQMIEEMLRTMPFILVDPSIFSAHSSNIRV